MWALGPALELSGQCPLALNGPWTAVCTARCKECGSRVCTGCRAGGECVVTADAMPPIDALKNGAGKPYDPKVYQILVDYRKTKRAELGLPATVKVARVDVSVGNDEDECSECDYYDQYHVL